MSLKQALMLVVLALMASFLPGILRLQRAVAALPKGTTTATEQIRHLVDVGARYEIGMRGAALLALLLAVWKPNR